MNPAELARIRLPLDMNSVSPKLQEHCKSIASPLTFAHFDGHVGPDVLDHDGLGLPSEHTPEVAFADRFEYPQTHRGVILSVRKVRVAMGLQNYRSRR